jgi:hypothetical protein
MGAVARNVRDEKHIRYLWMGLLSLSGTICCVNKLVNNGTPGSLYLALIHFLFAPFLRDNSIRTPSYPFVTIMILATFLHSLYVTVVSKVCNRQRSYDGRSKCQ